MPVGAAQGLSNSSGKGIVTRLFINMERLRRRKAIKLCTKGLVKGVESRDAAYFLVQVAKQSRNKLQE